MRITLITGIIWFVSIANAEAQKPITDTISLKGVEISTRKLSRKETSSFPLQNITETAINLISGYSVAEAVKNFSGVSLRDYGGVGGLKTILVRSVGSAHTGVFIDGAPLSDISGGQIDLGKLPLDGLGEVTLSIGSSINDILPARASSFANVILLKSKIPDFGTKKTIGSIGLRAGSFGLINPTMHLSAKTGKKSWLKLNINHLKSKGNYTYLVDNGPAGSQILKRGNSDINALSANIKFDILLSDSTHFKSSFRIYNSERGLPGAVVYYNEASAQRLAIKDAALHLEFVSNKKKYRLLSNAGYARSWLRYTDPYYLGYTNNLDNLYLQQEYYASQAIRFQAGKNLVTAVASDLIINTFSSDIHFNQNPKRYSLLISGSFSYQKAKTESSAGLLLNLTLDKTEAETKSNIYSKISPYGTFSVKLMQQPALRFRLMYRQTFRMPSFNELYYNIVGNRSLMPEKAGQINAGLLLSENYAKSGHLQMRVDVFSNRINDKIIAIPTQNLFIWSMKNIGKVSINGIEVQVENDNEITSGLKLGVILNYTFQKSIDITDKSTSEYRHQIPYIPFETFSGNTVLKFRNLSLNYSLLFNGYRYSASENISENLLPGWWISDAGISWAIKSARLEYTVKGEISNLLNKDYVVIRSFPMPGRSFSLTVNVCF